MQVIYADVLIFLNTVITFILLLTVKAFAATKAGPVRFALASFVGGVYSLIIFAPKIHFLLLLLARAAMCVSITFIAFHVRNIRMMLRCASLFLLISFLYAGIIYAFNYFFQSEFLIVNNGAAYFQMSAVSLILLSAAVYGVMFLLRRTLFRYRREDMIFDVSITFLQRDISVKALMDSGHSVRDAYTGKPVIILTAERASALTGLQPDAELSAWANADARLCFRLLPVHALGADQFLPAFLAEKVSIHGKDTTREFGRVCIAVTKDPLGKKRYQALISEDFM